MKAQLPNFLIVGGEKAGTTSLATFLDDHPEAYMATPKEVRFFTDLHWHKGLGWYRRHFRGAAGYRAIGEASPAYTWYPRFSHVPERIQSTLGSIRYIYILRHPVQRFLSHYVHGLYHRWFKPDLGLEQANQAHHQFKDCSRYFLQLRQFFPYTSRDQWLFLTLEDFARQPNVEQAKLCRFLDIAELARIKPQRKNAAKDRFHLPEWMRPLENCSLTRRVLHSRLGIRLWGRKFEKPRLSDEDYRRYVEEFRPDVEALSEFVGRDLVSFWNMDSGEPPSSPPPKSSKALEAVLPQPGTSMEKAHSQPDLVYQVRKFPG